jgi:peptidoglycan/LPS O-acetylase OafA/YrhL
MLFVCATAIKIFIPLQTLQHWFHFEFVTWYSLGYVFLTGSTLYTWRDKIGLHYQGIVVLAFVWWLTALLHLSGNVPEVLFFVYTIIFLGRKTYIPVAFKSDLSYGIYIYGSPVQRTVSWLTKSSLSLWQFNCIVVPVTVLMGFLSWHLVEKKALRFKNKVK